MNICRMGIALALAWLLAGCAATGPKFAEVEASIPTLRAGEGRVYFYRDVSGVGAAVKPDIRLNGQVVGSVAPGGFFFVDRPAGTYTASSSTETDTSVQFQLADGQSAYLQFSITMGLMVGRPQLALRGEAEGKAQLPALAYVGSIPLSPGGRRATTATTTGATPGAPSATPPTRTTAREPARSAGPVSMDDLSGLLPPKR